MPNWCNNILIINGEHDDIKKFYLDNKLDNYEINNSNHEKCLTFEKSVSMPDYIFKGNIGMNERKKYGSNNWYDWSLSNWGTKWDCTDCYIDNFNKISNTKFKQLKYYFLTAWSPPIPWLNKVVEKYKTINFEFEYIEEAMDFAGKIICSNGLLVLHEQYSPNDKIWDDYDKTKLINFIKNYLNEFTKNNIIENFSIDLLIDKIDDEFNEDDYILSTNEKKVRDLVSFEKNLIIESKVNKLELDNFDSGKKIFKLNI